MCVCVCKCIYIYVWVCVDVGVAVSLPVMAVVLAAAIAPVHPLCPSSVSILCVHPPVHPLCMDAWTPTLQHCTPHNLPAPLHQLQHRTADVSASSQPSRHCPVVPCTALSCPLGTALLCPVVPLQPSRHCPGCMQSVAGRLTPRRACWIWAGVVSEVPLRTDS
jgi:hypothetical protein